MYIPTIDKLVTRLCLNFTSIYGFFKLLAALILKIEVPEGSIKRENKLNKRHIKPLLIRGRLF